MNGYRIDQRQFSFNHVQRSVTYLSVNIPDTEEDPVARNNPTSPSRLWSNLSIWARVGVGSTHYGLLFGDAAQGGILRHAYRPHTRNSAFRPRITRKRRRSYVLNQSGSEFKATRSTRLHWQTRLGSNPATFLWKKNLGICVYCTRIKLLT
jgi:hypothetical protein